MGGGEVITNSISMSLILYSSFGVGIRLGTAGSESGLPRGGAGQSWSGRTETGGDAWLFQPVSVSLTRPDKQENKAG